MGASEVLTVAAAVEAQAVAGPVRSARPVEVSEDAVEVLVWSVRSGLAPEGAVGVVSEDAVRPVVVSEDAVEVLVWSARPVIVSEDAVEALVWSASGGGRSTGLVRQWWRSKYWSGPPDQWWCRRTLSRHWSGTPDQ